MPVAQPPVDVADDVHHVAVALDAIRSSTRTVPDSRDAADVVAAQVHQHDVLGALLGVGEQFRAPGADPPRGSRRAGGCRRWAAPSPAVLTLDQISGDWSRRVEIAHLEVKHVRRGVDGAQGAVDVERVGRR